MYTIKIIASHINKKKMCKHSFGSIEITPFIWVFKQKICFLSILDCSRPLVTKIDLNHTSDTDFVRD